jgi:uncharacterized protein DUF559/putative AbiEi antitoxin of type IV toxin-antitoxin system/transcriptional regulator with AbiEi antitoxin domain of type IV toxin-antitoxin system
MGAENAQSSVWETAQGQHGVISRRQLLELGLSPKAIRHRLERGRLHALLPGVYSVGRPGVTRHGRWIAAVLSCGPTAALSHQSAAALWEVKDSERGRIEVSISARTTRRRPGLVVHRRAEEVLASVTRRDGIPVTTPVRTLVDLATRLRPSELEAAVNEADKLDLVHPDSLRASLDRLPTGPGLAVLRKLLDRRTFLLTESELERRFLPLARRAGLPPPCGGEMLNGFKVDFFWPELGLVVETDGLRYHRTPAQQTRDRLRDQTHTAAGLTCLRFTHSQVTHEPHHVVATLATIAARLRSS